MTPDATHPMSCSCYYHVSRCDVYFFFFFLLIPSIIFAAFHSPSPSLRSCNSDPRSLSRPFSPSPATLHAFILYRQKASALSFLVDLLPGAATCNCCCVWCRGTAPIIANIVLFTSAYGRRPITSTQNHRFPTLTCLLSGAIHGTRLCLCCQRSTRTCRTRSTCCSSSVDRCRLGTVFRCDLSI